MTKQVDELKQRLEELIETAATLTRETAESIDYSIEYGQELTKETAEYLLGEINRLYHIKERTADEETAYRTLEDWHREFCDLYPKKDRLLSEGLGDHDSEVIMPILQSAMKLTTVYFIIANGRDRVRDLERSMLGNAKGLADLSIMSRREREERGLPEY